MTGDEAVCQVAPEWWGAYGDAPARPLLAARGCDVCPLKGDPCLDHMAAGGPITVEDVGLMVVSGLSRQNLVDEVNARADRPVRWVKPCGTEAAYRRHRKAGETPCQPCRTAHAQAKARRAA